jgi:hypothetical protein
MDILVELIETKERALLIGTGLGTYASARPSLLWGNLDPKKETGVVDTVAICGKDGKISWVRSNQIKVISINGKTLDLFEISESLDFEFITKCKQCGAQLSPGDNACENCKFVN